MHTTLTSLGSRFTSPQVHLFDHFYFQRVPEATLQLADELTKRIAAVSRGRNTRIFSELAELVGKVGEFVVRDYLSDYWPDRFTSYVERVNPHGGDKTDVILYPGSLACDIKTRQLHTDDTIAPNFDLRVPYTELEKPQDCFVLAAYCPTTQYGYVLGWATWDEVQRQPLREDIRFPSKCLPLRELHPIQELAGWAAGALG